MGKLQLLPSVWWEAVQLGDHRPGDWWWEEAGVWQVRRDLLTAGAARSLALVSQGQFCTLSDLHKVTSGSFFLRVRDVLHPY